MSERTEGGERLGPDHCGGSSGVDERTIEQAEPELVSKQPPGGGVDTRFVDLAGTHKRDQDLGAVLAAELIDSRVKRLDDPLSQAEVFDPPALRLDQPAIDDFVC